MNGKRFGWGRTRIVRAAARTGLLLLAMAALAFMAQQASADEVLLDKMTVTARGVARPVTLTPGSVGIIEAEEIEETTPLGLSNVAARLPGVDISDDSPYGADISIRGLGRDSVVFLIDGCRVNMTTDLNGRFGMLHPMDVERIEVLKGPVSTLYGSGSTGGVVNIVTKKGRFTDEPEWHGEAMATFSTNPQGPDLYVNLSYNSPDAWAYVSGAWREGADYYSGGGEIVPNSQFEDWQGKLALGFAWNDEHETSLQYQHLEGDKIGIPGKGMSTAADALNVTLADNDRAMLQLEHTWKPDDLLLTESVLLLSYQKIERNPRLYNNANGATVYPEAIYETKALNWKNVLELDGHTLVAGVDAWQWHYLHSTRKRYNPAGALIGVDTPTPNTVQNSVGLYAEDDWGLAEDWILNLGLRGDVVSVDNKATDTVESGGTTSLDWGAHLGLTWVFAPDWSMTGLVAAAYRSPNILERYKNINLGGGITERGNPDLHAEQSLMYEWGLHYIIGSLRWDTAVYLNTVEDFIDSTLVAANTWEMSNVARARIWGFETSAQWIFSPGWSLYGDLAYAEGFDDKTGEALRFVAPLNGMLGLRQDLESGFWWASEVEWAAEQHKVPEEIARSDSWAVLNLRCGLDFELAGLDNQVILALNNVFDNKYHNFLATSRGFELREPGRGLDLSWGISF